MTSLLWLYGQGFYPILVHVRAGSRGSHVKEAAYPCICYLTCIKKKLFMKTTFLSGHCSSSWLRYVMPPCYMHCCMWCLTMNFPGALQACYFGRYSALGQNIISQQHIHFQSSDRFFSILCFQKIFPVCAGSITSSCHGSSLYEMAKFCPSQLTWNWRFSWWAIAKNGEE